MKTIAYPENLIIPAQTEDIIQDYFNFKCNVLGFSFQQNNRYLPNFPVNGQERKLCKWLYAN